MANEAFTSNELFHMANEFRREAYLAKEAGDLDGERKILFVKANIERLAIERLPEGLKDF